ncbi:MAG: hydrogenase accessory protein HypB [Lachnospiraceae bacterium]|uniref:Hydrogenase nickel incorporation protein HypB n=1 Tax=Candidatus Weimeria bifida TaxID=2599074 RepID=A0A6N7J1D8_9FIRM|nr:hydrogenase nickel incorporation protein HypB [Candidatus Weimeria bifida]RRF97013.1 MAG: hydrogenase accessory protein HypB [Lachnospiraceae bacterium]
MSNRDFEILETKERVIEDNDKVAAEVRSSMKSKGIFFVNLMSSPGAGKTTTLVRTIKALKDEYRIGVMEADVDSDVDAKTVADAGAKVIQLHTGGSCHMDADMTKRGLEGLGLDDLDIVFLENVGNLVCPAEFDVGQNKEVVILSVPEGDDKPLKYPLMFKVADILLVNKFDTRAVFDFSINKLCDSLNFANPALKVIPISAKTGDGFDEWISWLKRQAALAKEADK